MAHGIARRQLLIGLSAGAAALALGASPRSVADDLPLAAIKRDGRLRIGVEASYPPFSFRDSGRIAGYDVDLAHAFCARLGVEPVFVDTAWAGVIPSLYAKKFDLVMSALSYSPERLKRVAFTIPYVEASQALLVRAGDAGRIRGAADLEGKVLGVKLGSPGQLLQARLAEALRQAGGNGFREVKIFDDHPAAYMALAQGRVDAVLNTLPTLAIVMRDAPGRYAVVRGVGDDNWAGIATRHGNAELVAFLDAELARMKADDSLYRLQEKWLGFRMQLADRIPAFA